MDINFDSIKDLGATPPSVVIDKVVIQDGKAMELQIGPFQPIKLDHDKTNNDAMTLWYTRCAGDEKVETINVRIRLFLDGHTITFNSYLFDVLGSWSKARDSLCLSLSLIRLHLL